MSLPETEWRLVVRLGDPDDELAWQEFASLYESFLQSFFRRRGLQDADARDLTQQVLLAVSRCVNTWKPDGKPESFRRWLLTIARHAVIKFLTRDAKQPSARGGTDFLQWLQEQPPNLAAEDAAALATYQQEVLSWALKQVRTEFRESTWAAFWRTSIQQETVETVARDLELTPGAIYMARSRVMAALRRRTQELDVDDHPVS